MRRRRWVAAAVAVAAIAGAVASGTGAGLGDVTEVTVPSTPVGITAAADGNLWVASQLGNAVSRVTPAGVVTSYPVAGWPTGIATAADGSVWFTLMLANAIGRMSPDGTGLQTFALPQPSASVAHIARGADGAMWFTQAGGNRIGRIDATGAITEFPLPTPGATPLAIAAGPDGALWFTEYAAGKIGRITTAGAITEFALGDPAANPNGIVAGPDGALWFSQQATGRVGRITVSGTISEIALPSAASEPVGLAFDRFGNLVVAEMSETSNAVAVITPAGRILEFPAPAPRRRPTFVATLPDGSVWVTEQGAARVARIDTGSVRILGPSSTTTQAPTFAFDSLLSRPQHYCSVDGTPFVTCPSPVTLHGLAAGAHTLAVRATSGSFVSPVATVAWTVVSPGPPDTFIDSATVTGSSARLVFHSDQAGSRFQCQLDLGPWKTCSSGLRWNGLAGRIGAPVTHEIRVRAVNFAGDIDPTPAVAVAITPAPLP